MPMVWSSRQVQAGAVDEIAQRLDGKHLPTCNNHDLLLAECTCGGPERSFLLRAYAESLLDQKSLVSSSASVI